MYLDDNPHYHPVASPDVEWESLLNIDQFFFNHSLCFLNRFSPPSIDKECCFYYSYENIKGLRIRIKTLLISSNYVFQENI